MRSFTITNADNTKMNVDLICYFKFKTDCFLIYSIGEVDDKNYKKLYLVRIMEELGFPVVQTIKNDADWANMQGIVKKVLKELKKNKKKMTEDLDYHEIDGIKIVNPRFFKLDAKLVDILASNYMNGDEVSVNNEVENMNVQTPVANNTMDILNNENSEINNISNEVSNMQEINDNSDNQLESIDETIMNQGEFTPINMNVSENLQNQDVQNIGNEIVNNDVTTNEENLEKVAESNSDNSIEPIVESSDVINPVEPIEPVEINDSSTSINLESINIAAFSSSE